jgi:3-hydroxyisobutyrate dehydrogenase-like beta-hydroxyacid dehydrogenase
MASHGIALFHPGEMGSAVGAALAARGRRVLCALSGRSAATGARAAGAGLEDAGTLTDACGQAAVVLSVCPPHAALELARAVAATGFKGLYIDANAISPETTRKCGAAVEAAGASFVDGGIIGAPPTAARHGKLHLCGPRAREAAELFEGSFVDAAVLEGPVGAASALKACYAAWTKGTWLLLASVYATAQREGVETALRGEWGRNHPDLLKQLAAPSLNPAKGWRWLAEMEEIAATFEAAGQPGGFALAAAEICRRLERYKDDASKPSIETVAPALRKALS